MTRPTTQKFSYSVTDFFQTYDGPLTKEQYGEIISLYCDMLFETMLKGYQIKLPQGLGYLTIRKMKGKSINWAETKRFFSGHNENSDDKKRIFERNEHTDGFIAFVKWNKKHHPLPRKSFFKFELNRRYKRQLAKLIKETPSLIGNFNEV